MALDEPKTLLVGDSGLLGTVLRRLEPNLLALAQDDVGIERKTVKGLALKLGKREVGNLRRVEVSFSVP